MEYLNDTPYFFQLYIIFVEGSNMNGTLNEEDFILRNRNDSVFGLQFGNFTIVDSNEYTINSGKSHGIYVKYK